MLWVVQRLLGRRSREVGELWAPPSCSGALSFRQQDLGPPLPARLSTSSSGVHPKPHPCLQACTAPQGLPSSSLTAPTTGSSALGQPRSFLSLSSGGACTGSLTRSRFDQLT